MTMAYIFHNYITMLNNITLKSNRYLDNFQAKYFKFSMCKCVSSFETEFHNYVTAFNAGLINQLPKISVNWG